MKVLLLAIGIIFSCNIFAQEKGTDVPPYVVQLDIEGETYLLNGNQGYITCTFFFGDDSYTTVGPQSNSGNYDYLFRSNVGGISWVKYRIYGFVSAPGGSYKIDVINDYSGSGYTEYLSAPWVLHMGH